MGFRSAPTVDLVLLSHGDLPHSGLYAYAHAHWGLTAPAYTTLPVQAMARIAATEDVEGIRDEQQVEDPSPSSSQFAGGEPSASPTGTTSPSPSPTSPSPPPSPPPLQREAAGPIREVRRRHSSDELYLPAPTVQRQDTEVDAASSTMPEIGFHTKTLSMEETIPDSE